MSTLNLLNPSKDNLQSNLYLGSFLVGISLLDVFLNSFLKLNITSFLPSIISLLLPFLLGMFGLHLMRIEFSGIKNLDRLNKNINTNNFNAALTLLIISIEIVSITMLTYLTLSLSISFFMNWYNAKIAIVEK